MSIRTILAGLAEVKKAHEIREEKQKVFLIRPVLSPVHSKTGAGTPVPAIGQQESLTEGITSRTEDDGNPSINDYNPALGLSDIVTHSPSYQEILNDIQGHAPKFDARHERNLQNQLFNELKQNGYNPKDYNIFDFVHDFLVHCGKKMTGSKK